MLALCFVIGVAGNQTAKWNGFQLYKQERSWQRILGVFLRLERYSKRWWLWCWEMLVWRGDVPLPLLCNARFSGGEDGACVQLSLAGTILDRPLLSTAYSLPHTHPRSAFKHLQWCTTNQLGQHLAHGSNMPSCGMTWLEVTVGWMKNAAAAGWRKCQNALSLICSLIQHQPFYGNEKVANETNLVIWEIMGKQELQYQENVSWFVLKKLSRGICHLKHFLLVRDCDLCNAGGAVHSWWVSGSPWKNLD